MGLIAGVTVVVLVVASVVAFAAFNARTSSRPLAGAQTVTTWIPCDQLENTQVHYHAALQIVREGVLTAIPSNIGIRGDPASPDCYYWLHVHAYTQNVIHVESPADRTFTLGDFFSVWSVWSTNKGGPREPLDTTHVSSFTLTAGEKLDVYVDAGEGGGAQPFTGDPNTIVLKEHEVITLEIASGQPAPPPVFDWDSPTTAGL